MSEAVREAAHWNDHADPTSIWGEPIELWDEGVAHCAQQILCSAPELLHGPTFWDVFDLGCGVGRLTLPISRSWDFDSVVGYDVSSEMINRATLAALVANEHAVSFVQSDGRTIPADDASFDFGWSVLLFQHIPPDAQYGYLREAWRVLRPGGKFIVQIDAATETGGEFLHWHTSPWDLSAAWPDLKPVQFSSDERYPQWQWLTFEKEDPQEEDW